MFISESLWNIHGKAPSKIFNWTSRNMQTYCSLSKPSWCRATEFKHSELAILLLVLEHCIVLKKGQAVTQKPQRAMVSPLTAQEVAFFCQCQVRLSHFAGTDSETANQNGDITSSVCEKNQHYWQLYRASCSQQYKSIHSTVTSAGHGNRNGFFLSYDGYVTNQ